jgi:hypothetical protein
VAIDVNSLVTRISVLEEKVRLISYALKGLIGVVMTSVIVAVMTVVLRRW